MSSQSPLKPSGRLAGPRTAHRRRAALGGAAAGVLVFAGLAPAQTAPLKVYVFNTGDDTLTSASVQDWVTQRAGTTNVSITVLNAAAGGANFLPDGTPVAFSASGDTATARVRGNLTGGNDMRFYGVGSRMLSIDVAGNATLGQNFVVDVSARGATGGAGGGSGGAGGVRANYTHFLPAQTGGGRGGYRNAEPPPTAGGQGTRGYYRIPGQGDLDPALYGILIKPIGGTRGTAGANDYLTSPGGSVPTSNDIPIIPPETFANAGAAGTDSDGRSGATAGGNGGDGASGYDGRNGFGGAPEVGAIGTARRGGDGGRGGSGGRGGDGGNGGGGSGGNIHLVSSTLYSANSIYNLPGRGAYSAAGGGGATSGRINFSNFGSRENVATTLNLSHIAGRPTSAGTGYYQLVKGDAQGQLPENVVGYVKSGLPRLDFAPAQTDEFASHRYLTFTNIRGTVSQPKWSAVSAADVEFARVAPAGYAYVPDGPEAFLQGGYLTDPAWTAGATGPTTINSIGNGQTYLTTIRSDDAYAHTFTHNPYGTERKFTFSEADIAGGAAVTDIGRLRLRGSVQAANGSGPVTELYDVTNDNTNQFVQKNIYVRAGTKQTLTYTVENTGNTFTRLRGSAIGTGITTNYQGLEPGRQQTVGSLTLDATNYQPGEGTSEGSPVQFYNLFDNQGVKSVATQTGFTVVGPAFKVATGDVVEFDAFGDKKFERDNVVVQNAATKIAGADDGLLALSVNGVSISGPDAALFKLADGRTDISLYIAPGTPGFPSFVGSIPVVFTPDRPGDFTAYLTIQTDVGTDFRGDGEDYVVSLHGVSSVPEPVGFAVLAISGTALLKRRRC